MNRKHALYALVVAAASSVASITPALAQSTYDENQVLLSQIQADKRAVVLGAMALDDAQVRAFTPVYDAYQADRRKIMDRAVELLNSYASNYDSMTDDAAKSLMKDWFKLQKDEDVMMEKHAKKMQKVLPAAKVLRFVQIENKLNTLLRLPTLRGIPLAQ
jgi:hypothetical protein